MIELQQLRVCSAQVLWCFVVLMIVQLSTQRVLVVSAERPNIVLIMADDLGYGDLGCYGSEINPTEHIDALAEHGLRFLDFHSAGPMCSPTRAATMTGQYQQRFGRMFDTAISGSTQHDRGLPHEAQTVAEVLKPVGYVSACFGKWHLGYRPPFLPLDQGFDEFRGLGSGDGDFHTHIDRLGREDWWQGNELRDEVGYTTDLLTRSSVDFIARNHQQPFFLYVPHLAIHFPWQGPEDPPHRVKGRSYLEDKFGIIPDPSNVAPHVKAMIRSLDASVGAIMAELRKWQLEEKTLVIFTSDNGGYVSYGRDFRNISSNGPLRGQKTELYEGGHRVPMIMSWPGKIQAGVTDATTNSIDLLPTFAALAGIDPARHRFDGVDLSALIFGGEPLGPRTLFWRAGGGAKAVRQGPWKLLMRGKQTELYHLGDDLGEQHDLADSQGELVARLAEAWQDWEADVNQSAKQFEP